ncbi:MAG TPA: hypothetical protein VMT85_09330 [Thermoanaerobaculia bacterium]|nr:hypothetical protein [Thermoanaerobaculia bacterium]
MSSAPGKRLTIRCPHCRGEMVVDAGTGAILSHRASKAPPGGGKSFEDLFADLERDKSRAEALFDQEREAMKDRERILEERFRKAVEDAGDVDDDTPPPRPFDLD